MTPDTSFGFSVIDFAANVVGMPLDPWQQWVVIHAGELLEDGTPRFRTLLIIVARQNGKTHLLKILALYWMFVESVSIVLGISTKLEYAKMSMKEVVSLAESSEELKELLSSRRSEYVKVGNNDVCFMNTLGSTYKIAAANANAGRSLTVQRLIVDELRQQRDFTTWDACIPTMNAVPDAQAWCITNQGDIKAVVLDALRDSALENIKSGDVTSSLGLFEYSSLPNADVEDIEGLKAANPNLGYRVQLPALLEQARQAKQAGGEKLTGFQTEIMCQKVYQLDGAVDPQAWEACHVEGNMEGLKSKLAMCVDISPDLKHATIAVAGVMNDGRVRVEVVRKFEGSWAVRDFKKELPGWVSKVKPKTLGWFPNGPAATVAAELAVRAGRHTWPPPGVTITDIKSEVAAVCMGFSEQVGALQIAHGDEPILNDHVTGAGKLHSGDVWRFSRKGEGHCDAAYAAAGAVFLAKTLPESVGGIRLVTSRNG